MKQLLAFVSALVLTGLLVTTVLAKGVNYTACTLDRMGAVLSVVLKDDVLAERPDLEQSVGIAFAKTARSLVAERLVDAEGYQLFITNLGDANVAIDEIVGPPVILDKACYTE